MERAATGNLGEEKIMVLSIPGVKSKARTTFLQTPNGSLAFLASIATV